ncbi:hypothetical protein PRCB_16490 [Pantoea rodasii]|uniref:Uncharacterized protein n=1 Tax=Pantoea rodasii TaxID=1076549 RepID=A0A2M9WBU4_9GAMM|nr:hypothetical protein [Pantoea rodasii]ORM64527.1 hypothetical protein HA45_09160 [Pantoea rodasii]PJZ04999.1 hypothetical protein PRCB_16490 [Pantoea rodasii]
MFVDNHLPVDEDNPGMVKAWGVVRSNKWHLAGVYGSKEEAAVKADEMGADYFVHYGSHKLGTDDFVWGG